MLISYYPTYSNLDEIINLNSSNVETLNIYIDLKNCIQPLYMQHNVELLTENTKKFNRIDSTLITDVLSFLSFHKIYALKRKFKINFFMFYEMGESYYHLNIYKHYKIRRKIDKYRFVDKPTRELFYTILNRNFSLINKIGNIIPNIYVFGLENLEADFIPYYLIRNKLVEDTPNVCHIIYSNDHDLFQVLELSEHNNIFQFRKMHGKKQIVKTGEAINTWLKINNSIHDMYFPFVMALVGDAGDDIEGIPGIGPKRVIEAMNCIYEHNKYDMDRIYVNIEKENKLGIDLDVLRKENKILNNLDENILIRNIKLISFEYLSRHLDDPPNTETLDKRKKIKNIITEKKITSWKNLSEAMEKSQISLMAGNELDILYSEIS